MRGRADGGFILVFVLVLAGVLSTLAGAALMVSRSAATLARLGGDLAQADQLLAAGAAAAAFRLFHGGGAPADGALALDLAAGRVEVRIRDEGGLVDLNRSDPRLLAGLYRAAGNGRLRPDEFAERIVAWRERRDEERVTRPAAGGRAGAPAAGDERPDEGTRPPPRLFRSVEELARVPGIAAGDVAALAPYLTVYNFDGRVSLAGAPATVLAAFPGLNAEEARRIVALRRAAAGRPDEAEALERIRTSFGERLRFARAEAGPAFRLDLAARLADGLARTAQAVIAAGSDERPFHVLEWAEP